MFLEHFGLRDQPFGVTPDPRYLFSSPAHREALASLIYGIESNLGFSTLIAEPGMGKTTLLFQILERYRQCARTAFIFNTQCNSHELMRALLSELDDREAPPESFQLHERFKEILTKAAEDRRMVILVIDEAHNLDRTVMETIRLLSNFESSSFKLLHIILAGQPELATKLTQHDLCQLQQRIPILTCLPRLSHDETASYIEHRLLVAGHQVRSIFTPASVARIAGLSRGVPREINRLCFNCLSLAYALAKPVVDVEVFEEVAADLDLASRLKARDEAQPQPHHKASEPPPAVVQAAVAPSGTPENVKRPPVREPETPKLMPTPVGPSAGTTRPPTPVVPRVATAAPGRSPARVPERRPALAASQRLRSPKSVVPTLAYRWPSRWRPIAFALFYLTVILAGWASATRWLYPIAQAARHPSEEKTVKEQPRPSDDDLAPALERGRAAVAQHETRPERGGEAPSRPAASPTNFEPRASRWPAREPSVRTDAQPGLIKFVRPQYPWSARNRHIEGTVILNAMVARDGRVKGVRQVRGDPTLLKAAETAVRGWVYRPYHVNGRPVDIDREIVISFSLPKDQP